MVPWCQWIGRSTVKVGEMVPWCQWGGWWKHSWGGVNGPVLSVGWIVGSTVKVG